MSNDLHWGGVNFKRLCKAALPDIWMVFAVMVITYFSLGIVESMRYSPLYTSSTVVAVYPLDKMYTPEASSSALETVSSANEVFNSEMFRTGLKEFLTENVDFSLTSQQINGTFILMLSVTGPSPENAYRTLRSALDYYKEISSHLVGDNHLEILAEPDFPVSVSNESKILKYRPFLAVLLGLAMAGFLVLIHVMRKTYKTESAIRNYYKNVRFFRVKSSATKKHNRGNKRRSVSVPNKEAMRKTTIELLQILRAKKAKSILVTSADSDEGNTEIIASLARELACSGKIVTILEKDPENSEILEVVEYVKVIGDLTDQNIKVVFADKDKVQDDFSDMTKEVENTLELAGNLADVVLVDGVIWTGSRDDQIWKEAVDASLAICRQDKADFYAIDQMMTDLQDNKSGLLGCILYGF